MEGCLSSPASAGIQESSKTTGCIDDSSCTGKGVDARRRSAEAQRAAPSSQDGGDDNGFGGKNHSIEGPIEAHFLTRGA